MFSPSVKGNSPVLVVRLNRHPFCCCWQEGCRRSRRKLPAQGKACLTEDPIKEDGCRWQPSSLMNLFLLQRCNSNMQLIQSAFIRPRKNDGAFYGGPRTDHSAEVNSACGKVLLRKTLGVEQKRQRKGSYRGLFLLQRCNSNMQLIQLLLVRPPQNDGAFYGALAQITPSAEVNSGFMARFCSAKRLVWSKSSRGRETIGVYSSSCAVIAICSSSSCFCSTVEGAPIMTS